MRSGETELACSAPPFGMGTKKFICVSNTVLLRTEIKVLETSVASAGLRLSSLVSNVVSLTLTTGPSGSNTTPSSEMVYTLVVPDAIWLLSRVTVVELSELALTVSEKLIVRICMSRSKSNPVNSGLVVSIV